MMTKRGRKSLVASVFLLVLTFLLAGAPGVQAAESGYQGFVSSLAKSLFFLAWPTAIYEDVEFGDVEFVSSGAEVSFRLHGRSAFDDGHLWVDVVIVVRNGEVVDLRWGRNNAILAQPGSTIKVMAEELNRINQEMSSRQSFTSASGFGYFFSNKCSRPVQVAIHYMDTSNRWRTDGWWSFAPGESAFLKGDAGLLTSDKATWYFYARTTDAMFEWKGDYRVTLNGVSLGMRQMTDTQGNSEWSVSCQ